MSQGILVLVRHGESRFNELNLFTGWLDVPLTENGIKEAHRVASHCKQFDYNAVFTSHLERAHETLLIILSNQKKIGVFQHESEKRYNISGSIDFQLSKKILPVCSSRALNERAYGILQGMNKKKVAQIYGESQIFKWRRGFNDKPPQGESLSDVYKRAIPYFKKMILPRLKGGQINLVVGHGNTLRALIKFLENIDNDKIPFINLPFGHPLIYEYKDKKFKRIEGAYNFERPMR